MSPQKKTDRAIYIGSDHGGFPLKEHFLKKFSHLPWVDVGSFNGDSVDYPDFADKVACDIQSEKDRGILICGSGQGMAMRANKYPHIRAALCWNEESTRLSRQHNDANILVLGARLMDFELCDQMLELFLETPFEGGRHQRRVDKLKGKLPCH